MQAEPMSDTARPQPARQADRNGIGASDHR